MCIFPQFDFVLCIERVNCYGYIWHQITNPLKTTVKCVKSHLGLSREKNKSLLMINEQNCKNILIYET